MTLARDLNTILEDMTMVDPRPPEALELTTQAGTRVYEAWWKERQRRIQAQREVKVLTEAELSALKKLGKAEYERDQATAQGILQSEKLAKVEAELAGRAPTRGL